MGRFRVLFLLGLGLVYLLPTVGRFAGLLDEGLVLSAADRWASGQLPYRDFYLFTTPGPVAPFAAAFGVFGTSLVVAHVTLLVLRLLILLALYAVGRPLLGPNWALAPAVAYLFLYLAEPMNYLNHWVPNLPFLVTVALALRLVQAPGVRTAGLLGVAAVVTGLTLQTFGVVATLVGLWALGEVRRRDTLQAFLAGFGVTAVAFVGLLAGTGLLAQFWTDTVLSNLHRTGLERVTPGGFLSVLASMTDGPNRLTGGLLVVTQLVGLLGPWRWWSSSASLRLVLVAAWLMLGACSYRLLPSQLLLHGFLPLVLTAWVLARTGTGGRVVGLALGAGFVVLGGWNFQSALAARYPVTFPRGTAWVASAEEAGELARLVRFLIRRTPEGQAFFAPYEPNLYFLMGVKNPTRYQQLRSVQYSREQMQEALACLEHCPVFRFPAYETDGFLLWCHPNLDVSPQGAYRQQEAWFYGELKRTHRFEDDGAVQVYYPR